MFFRLTPETGRYAAATADGQADWGVIEHGHGQWVAPDRRYISCAAAVQAATARTDVEMARRLWPPGLAPAERP